jgi:urease accessory protein
VIPDRWAASLALDFEQRRGRTALVKRQQRGPLAVQRPFYPEADGTCHTYLLHPPAGIVGGDTLDVSLRLDTDARALVTTPGATRWYYTDRRAAYVKQHARIAAGACLEWLPQETLLFNGADAHFSSRIELTGSAVFFGWEIICLGRPACAENFDQGRLDFRLELWRDGNVLLRERVSGAGAPPGLHGYPAFMTLISSAADATSLALAREVCAAADSALSGATLIGDVLICRGLARECAPLTKLCRRLWTDLRPHVLGRTAVPPRIWRT